MPVQRQLQIDPLLVTTMRLLRCQGPVTGLVVEDPQRLAGFVEIDAVDAADELNRVPIDLKLRNERILVLGIILGVKDTPALAYKPALALGKDAQTLSGLFELQAHRGPPQLRAV